MTLEQILFELSTLVDYGIKYLKDRNQFTLDRIREIPLIDYLKKTNWKEEDLLDYVDEDSIMDYIRRSRFDYRLMDFVQDNYEIDDVYSDEEIADYIKDSGVFDIDDLFCIEDALEWVQNEYSPSDIVDCKMDWSNR